MAKIKLDWVPSAVLSEVCRLKGLYYTAQQYRGVINRMRHSTSSHRVEVLNEKMGLKIPFIYIIKKIYLDIRQRIRTLESRLFTWGNGFEEK